MSRLPIQEKTRAGSGGDKRLSPPARPPLNALALQALAIQALALTAVAAILAWLVGIKLLGRPYYFAWAIVAAMGLYLLLAWLLYLRDDAFMSKPREPGAARPGAVPGAPPAPMPLRRSVLALLLAAALLAVLSLVLYFRFGIGARP